MTTQHTPTPWTVDASKYSVSIVAGRFCVAQTATAATGNVEPAEANAAFIVRACNAHDELVAALNAITAETYKPSEGRTLEQTPETLDRVIGIARAALAKVQA